MVLSHACLLKTEESRCSILVNITLHGRWKQLHILSKKCSSFVQAGNPFVGQLIIWSSIKIHCIATANNTPSVYVPPLTLHQAHLRMKVYFFRYFINSSRLAYLLYSINMVLTLLDFGIYICPQS